MFRIWIMSNKITVLVIEDSRLIRQLVKAILSKAGYGVLEAESGEDGLALVVNHRPDVVLIDVLLAGDMDGLTVCHEIRSISGLEKTPVMIMSSLSQEADLAAGRLYGADDYLTKPINSQILLSRIASLLNPRGDKEKPETDKTGLAPPIRSTILLNDIAEYRLVLKACDQEIIELIGLNFLNTSKTELEEIIAAFKAEDWTTLERLAGTLKGLVGTFGATYLEYLLSQIGQDANCQQVDLSLIQNLEKEFPLFCAALAEHIKEGLPGA